MTTPAMTKAIQRCADSTLNRSPCPKLGLAYRLGVFSPLASSSVQCGAVCSSGSVSAYSLSGVAGEMGDKAPVAAFASSHLTAWRRSVSWLPLSLRAARLQGGAIAQRSWAASMVKGFRAPLLVRVHFFYCGRASCRHAGRAQSMPSYPPNWVWVTHAGGATGAFGGAPYGATNHVRGVPKLTCGHNCPSDRPRAIAPGCAIPSMGLVFTSRFPAFELFPFQ